MLRVSVCALVYAHSHTHICSHTHTSLGSQVNSRDYRLPQWLLKVDGADPLRGHLQLPDALWLLISSFCILQAFSGHRNLLSPWVGLGRPRRAPELMVLWHWLRPVGDWLRPVGDGAGHKCLRFLAPR